MRRLVISAPFGNYIQPRGASPTLGTFTALARPGRVRRIIQTVRYYRRIGAWVNKIGLRNPGIAWLEQAAGAGKVDLRDKVVSIHGLSDDEWRALIDAMARLRPMAVELNMSCPNIGHVNWPNWLFASARELESAGSSRASVIVKLPPVNYRDIFAQALGAGLRAFHCCNTIPVPAGGISGKPLKPFSLACIADVRERAGAVRDELVIIGGGGVTTTSDIDEYAEVGATHIAIGTKVFNPKYMVSTKSLQPLIRHADQRFQGRPNLQSATRPSG